jgi:hypothetical protein
MTVLHFTRWGQRLILGAALGLLAAGQGHAEVPAKSLTSPTGKLFVADVQGAGEVESAGKTVPLSKRYLFTAPGAIVRVSPSADAKDPSPPFSALVYSNGTGMYLGHNTRIEVKTFSQEPFLAGRTDLEIEPSISRTETILSVGMVGLCTNQLVAGSSMIYRTPHATVDVRGHRILIEVTDQFTRITVLEGESRVRGGSGGSLEIAGHTLRTGERATIKAGSPGQTAAVEIEKISSEDMPELEAKVAIACLARRTVFFDVDAANGQEIVATDVIPANLPVQFTISPARLQSP